MTEVWNSAQVRKPAPNVRDAEVARITISVIYEYIYAS